MEGEVEVPRLQPAGGIQEAQPRRLRKVVRPTLAPNDYLHRLSLGCTAFPPEFQLPIRRILICSIQVLYKSTRLFSRLKPSSGGLCALRGCTGLANGFVIPASPSPLLSSEHMLVPHETMTDADILMTDGIVAETTGQSCNEYDVWGLG